VGNRRTQPRSELKFVEKSIDITGQLKVLKELVVETSNADSAHSMILQHNLRRLWSLSTA
jgi:hypothetical protein